MNFTEKSQPQDSDLQVEEITDASVLELRLKELHGLLKLQVQALAGDHYERFISLSEDVSSYLSLVSNAKAQITHVGFEKINEIQKLNQQIGLTLSSRSAELAERMKKVKSGKQVVKAYNNAL